MKQQGTLTLYSVMDLNFKRGSDRRTEQYPPLCRFGFWKIKNRKNKIGFLSQLASQLKDTSEYIRLPDKHRRRRTVSSSGSTELQHQQVDPRKIANRTLGKVREELETQSLHLSVYKPESTHHSLTLTLRRRRRRRRVRAETLRRRRRRRRRLRIFCGVWEF